MSADAHSIFDAAFDRTAADTRQRIGRRIAIYIAGLLLCVVALGVRWAVAPWAFAICAELVLLWTTSPRRRYRGQHTRRWFSILVPPFAACGWVGICVAAWTQGTEPGRLIATALLAGQLLYTVRACHRSPVLMAGASGAGAIAIVVLPIGLMGRDPAYVGVEIAAILLVAFALTSAISAYHEHLALVAATRALEEQTERAEAANHAKSEFLANMSHEIRTPLNGVLGIAQAMTYDPTLTPKQIERLQIINRSGRALLDLLNDLLDLAKIEAGKIDLEDGVVDIEELARDAESSFSALCAGKDLYVAVEVTPAARGAWRGDPVRVRQILYNLVSNAVKFTTEGSVRIGVDVVGPELVVSVADTGPGIPAESLATLFDKFVQADSSTTRKYGGTGLGLAICQQLAGLMGGSIEVASAVGVGSTFTVRLPLERAAQAAMTEATEPGAPTPLPRRGLRILAAEDNPTNQMVLRSLLFETGVELEMTANGQEALDAWRRGSVDIVLMDVQMPVMDGLAATRAIRAEETAKGLAHTPVLAVTANAMAHHLESYAAAGLDGHVAKPLDRDRLLAAIATATLAPAAPKRRKRTKAALARAN